VLREVAPGLTPGDVQKLTEPKLLIAENLKTISL
jgi:acyl CoA:acetate/3-ketoacid CoA transferase beta subunit